MFFLSATPTPPEAHMTNTLPLLPPSAATISRLLKAAGFKRARTNTTSWSSGFEVQGFHTHARVTYTSVSVRSAVMVLEQMRDEINGRKDQKYWGRVEEGKQGWYLWVERYDGTDPAQNEVRRAALREKMAEESPYGVTIKEVRKVLNKGGRFFEFVNMGSQQGAGFEVTAETGVDERLVRVTYRDHEITGYALVEGGRESYMHKAVNGYAQALVEAGYSVQIDYVDGVDSVLVGQAGEFQVPMSQEEASEAAQEPLTALREAIEAKDISYMTRKAGPTSIFVYCLIPFKDKLRRLEVFWDQGSYGSYGQFGGPTRNEFHNTDLVVEYIHSEIGN
jgi:hypothetical protein